MSYVLLRGKKRSSRRKQGENLIFLFCFFFYIVLASRNQILLIINSSISVDTPISNRRRVFVLVNEVAIGEVHNEITYHL